jgi:maleate cis-trans isomerase
MLEEQKNLRLIFFQIKKISVSTPQIQELEHQEFSYLKSCYNINIRTRQFMQVIEEETDFSLID